MASADCSNKPAGADGADHARPAATSRSKLSIRRIWACSHPVAAVGVFVDEGCRCRARACSKRSCRSSIQAVVDAVGRLLQRGKGEQVREHAIRERHAGGLVGPVGHIAADHDHRAIGTELAFEEAEHPVDVRASCLRRNAPRRDRRSSASSIRIAYALSEASSCRFISAADSTGPLGSAMSLSPRGIGWRASCCSSIAIDDICSRCARRTCARARSFAEGRDAISVAD